MNHDFHNHSRRRRGTEHLHRCGPRVIAEALAELADRIGGAPAILATLAKFEQLTAAILRAAGGDRCPTHLRVIPK